MKTSMTLGLIGALSIVATAAAAEAPASYQRSASVYVADLDLARVADAYVLYERIDYAARSICAADELSFDVKKRRHWRECVESAVTGAVNRANAPVLTAIHLQRREQLARL